MLIALAVVLLQAALAFLSLDLIFRWVPLQLDGLQTRLRAYQRGYVCLAVGACLVGALAQWRSGGWAGLLLSLLNPIPWFLLWKFGLRKQFTFLFKDDGGKPMA